MKTALTMACDNTDQHRLGKLPRSRYWRVGEQRAVVGGCLHTAFGAAPAATDDTELLSLLATLETCAPTDA